MVWLWGAHKAMKPHQRIKPGQVKLLNVALTELKKAGGTAITKVDIKARFGVESTKELTNAQFDEAMEHFAACGFVYRPKGGGQGRPPHMIQPAQRIKQVYLAAINKALEELGKDWAYAEGIAKQMFGLDRVVWQWLSPEHLHKVQIALIYEERKQAGDPVARKPETLARRAAVSAAKRSAGGDACATGDACGTAKRRRGNIGQEI